MRRVKNCAIGDFKKKNNVQKNKLRLTKSFANGQFVRELSLY